MKSLIKMLAIVIVALSLFTGCVGGAGAVFPAIAAVVSDATAVLNIVQQAVNTWFRHKPDPELQEQFDATIAEAWTALRVATSATQGAEHLSQEDYDKAFADFQDAYARLHEMLKKHGILTGTKLSMGPNAPEQEIPEPLALSHKVK